MDAGLRRAARLGFSATAALAMAGYWLSTPDNGGGLFANVLLGLMAVLATAGTIVALVTAWRGETCPELVVLMLLFAGGIAMLVGIVSAIEGMFPLGAAVFATGAAFTGHDAPAAEKPTRRRRAES